MFRQKKLQWAKLNIDQPSLPRVCAFGRGVPEGIEKQSTELTMIGWWSVFPPKTYTPDQPQCVIVFFSPFFLSLFFFLKTYVFIYFSYPQVTNPWRKKFFIHKSMNKEILKRWGLKKKSDGTDRPSVEYQPFFLVGFCC